MARFLVPHHGNIFHFMTQCLLSAQTVLQKHKVWETGDCELWYRGRYQELVQCLSVYPVKSEWSTVPPEVIRVPKVFGIGLSQEEARRLTPLRERFLASLIVEQPSERPAKPLVTLIQRRGKREITNLANLKASLESPNRNVQLVYLEDHPPAEQIRLVWRTDILVGAHGAGLVHVFCMRPGSFLIELFPRGYNSVQYNIIATAFGLQYQCFESQEPSRLGTIYDTSVQEYLETRPWPSSLERRDLGNLLGEDKRKSIDRTLRDIASFPIDVDQTAQSILTRLEELNPAFSRS